MMNARPRILALFNQLYDWGGAGGELALPFILKHWTTEINLTIAVPRGGQEWLEKQNVTARYITWPALPLFFEHSLRLPNVLIVWMWRTLQACWILSSHARFFDVIYTSGDFFCNTIPASWLKRINPDLRWAALIHHLILPHKQRLRNQLLTTFGSNLMQQFSLSLVGRNADLPLTNNQGVRQALIQRNIAENKIKTIDSGLDLSAIQRAYALPDIVYDACYVGSFRASKAVPELVEVWSKVLHQLPKARLLIIGNGPRIMLNTINKKINEFGLEQNVVMRGYVPNESEEKGILDEVEKFSLMKASKIFVSLSYEEGWGRAVAEALACGIPAVAWDLPTYREIFADSVIAVPIGNQAECVRAIVRLLENESLRHELGARGVQTVSNYDFSIIARRQLQLILDILPRSNL
ncbi:MAG: glycosyltransferase family 4 protein [Chloroflexi bacterium]|nr:glycosyltransferase family 4 protein [Chloroflexota bacterium]